MKNIKRIIALIMCVVTLFSAVSISAAAATAPLKPELFSVTAVTADSVSLTWMPSENATGYRIYTYLNNKWKIVKDITATSVTVTKLSASKNYIFAVRSFRNVLGKAYFCEGYSYVKVRTKDLVETKLTGTAGVDYVDLIWGRVPGATGYAVYQYIDAKWQRIGITAKTGGRVKSLKGATTYYFAVRPYTEGDGKAFQGPVSNFLKIKTLDANKVKVICAAVSDSAVKLSWTKAQDSTGYRVYAYVNGQWKNVNTLMSSNTLSCTFKNLSSDTDYYFRVRAFKKSASAVKWFEPSDICKATTNPGTKDVYAYRVEELRKVLNSQKYTLSYTEIGGRYGNTPVTVARNGSSYYLYSKVNERPYILLNDKDGSAYIVLDEVESYIKVPTLLKGAFSISDSMSDFLPGTDWRRKAEIVTFNSQKVVCESYTNPENTKNLRFYFKTGKLVGIDEYSEGSLESSVLVQSVSSTSDPGIFGIPEGYTKLFFASVEDFAIANN